MGLDIYAGPFSRYYARDWLTVVQKMGAEQGMEVVVVRPGEPVDLPDDEPGLIERILKKVGLRKDPPPGTQTDDHPSNAEVQQLVSLWRDQIVQALTGPLDDAKPWNESLEADYDTDKPDWDGLAAVILWAAYAECPDLTPPSEPSREWHDDPAFQRLAESNGGDNYQALLRNCEVWLPIDMPGTFEGPLPNEHTVCFGSVPMLLRNLEALNDATWRADLGDASGSGFDQLPPPANDFEETARFGFRIMYRLTRFASDNRTPMILDY